jgi:RNA-directed DNA polymerase
MKRTRIDLVDIASRHNLATALWKAARGKRDRPDVAAFLARADRHLDDLARAILDEGAPQGAFHTFWIRDPKRRLIHAAGFADRVLHHAMLNLAEDTFERTLVPTSYACRPGLGVHRAVLQVQRNLRRYPWFVKIDIDGYFPSIHHDVLLGLLARRFKGDGFLRLWSRVLDGHHHTPGCGLPIGSLTSQHGANLYLDGGDRMLLALNGVRAHVRYMDDILWWCDSPVSARASLDAMRVYLDDQRALRVKPTWQIGRSEQGVHYCGYRILPGAVLLSARKRRRYRQLRQKWERDFEEGRIGTLQLQAGYDAVHAITLGADSLAWRRSNLKRFPPEYAA